MWEYHLEVTNRGLYILNEVFILKNSLTFKEIASALKCSDKTIISTIHEINDVYDLPKLFIEENSNIVSYNKKDNFSVAQIFHDFYINNKDFEILEYIFLNEYCSLEDLSENLYVSHSTALRYINVIRKNLKNYDIEITNAPFKIIGDEVQIRRFFSEYFTLKNDYEVINNFIDFEKVSFNVFMRFTNQGPYNIYRQFYNIYRWNLFVSLVRLKNSNFLSANEVFKKANNRLLPSETLVLETIFNINFNDESIWHDLEYIFRPKHVWDKETLENFKNITSTFYKRILKDFSIDLNVETFEIVVDCLINLNNSYFSSEYMLLNIDELKVSELKKSYPISLANITKESKILLKELNVTNKKVLFTLIMQTIALTPKLYEAMVNKEAKLLVNLCLMANEHQTMFIKEFLEHHFSNLASFVVHDSSKFLEREIVKSGIWIVDFSRFTESNVLMIDSIMIHNELPRITDFITLQLNETHK